MAGSLNKIMLIGNVGKQPEIKTMGSGTRAAIFTLATSESWMDKATGERRENTQWHKIVVFNEQIVSVVERFVDKGSKLFIEGQIETRKWTDANGGEQYSTEVVLRPYNGILTLLSERKAQEDAPEPKATPAPRKATTAPVKAPPAPVGYDDLDDDIPF